MQNQDKKCHQGGKCHYGRKCNINVYHLVQRKIKTTTKYRGDEIYIHAINSASQDRNCSIERKMIRRQPGLILKQTGNQASPFSHAMNTLDFWFESKSNLSSKICFTFTSVLRTRSRGHLWVSYPHGYYFFGFDFLQTRSYLLYPLITFECLKFILNRSHIVRSFVTFVKIYRRI